MENMSGIVPTLPVGNNMGFGGDGIWALLIFAMIFNNGGFFGGNGRPNNLATTDYVSNEFTQRAITDGFQNQANLLSNIASSVVENRYANQLAEGQTQRDILMQTNELNTNILTTALQNQAKMDECCCNIRTAIREDGEKTRALITQNTIQDLRDRLDNAQTIIASQNTVNAIRPYPVPAYQVSSPYMGIGFSNWYGNTVV